ncbi:hypothetical protein HK105_209243 [Polyrhizophydium stewartii]|uniref:Protein kinase domain-containing protein n=1 Tax=Polyrhizophydium stewartii TaxID=2732419 RepID=A0ABR4MVJ8_9FUNG
MHVDPAVDSGPQIGGPAGIAVRLGQALLKVAALMLANPEAARALAHRCNHVVLALVELLADGHNVLRSIQALDILLIDIGRFFKRASAKCPLLQVLLAAKTADRIRSFDSQLSLTLYVELSILPDAVDAAIAEDAQALPALLRSLADNAGDAFAVDSQHLETLHAISTQRDAALALVLDDPLASARLAALLDATAQQALKEAGRPLSPLREFSVDPDDVDIMWDRRIGAGSFGAVFHAKWGTHRVAAKILTSADTLDAALAVDQDAATWFALDHPNIVKLYRVCLNTATPFFIMPLMKGDLIDYLYKYADSGIEIRTGFLLGIARGMQYLHERPQPIVHGDLKANNVLIDKDGEVCITDFGLQRVKAALSSRDMRRTLAVRWTAPEGYIDGYVPLPPYDVFAFAMLAYQVITDDVPFAEVDDEVAKQWIIEGKRPKRPANTPDQLWSIITDCWRQNPVKRPSFRNIVARIAPLPSDKAALDHPSSSSVVGSMVNLRIRSPPAPGLAGVPLPALARPRPVSYMPDNRTSMMRMDIDILLEMLPEWCASLDITRINYRETWAFNHAGFPSVEWDEQSHLIALRPTNYVLSGALPDKIGELANLQTLNLGWNKLTELPESIGMLINLKKLSLNNNKLTALPESIGDLIELTELDLMWNKLTALPASICKLHNLMELGLKENDITVLPEAIGRLTQLRWLLMQTNSLTRLPDSIGNLTRLIKLDLSYNDIVELPESICNLTQLQHLYLWSNKISRLPKGFSKLQSSVKDLRIEDNPATADLIKKPSRKKQASMGEAKPCAIL